MGSLNQAPRPPRHSGLLGAVPAGPEPADLVAQLGCEVASTLSAALERVNALAATGRIDRPGLRALRDEIELARRIGMMGQQVSHFASGRVQLQPEPLDLDAMLGDALQQRSREIEARGIALRPALAPARVLGDATLTFTLVQALLQWSFEHARSRIDLTIDRKPWPAHARLNCAFAHGPDDGRRGAARAGPALETMSWHLLQQTATTLGLVLVRADGGGRTQASLEFPATIGDAIDGVSTIDLGDHGAHTAGAMSLAGHHLLVVATRRALREQVREVVRPMGLMIDFVTSVDDARTFCRGGLPHAVLHEAALDVSGFERLRRELLESAPALAFIRITDDGQPFSVQERDDRRLVAIGEAALAQALPAALLFELSRQS